MSGGKKKDDQSTQAAYWERLEKAGAHDVCQRTEAIYSSVRKGFVLPVLNQKYLILPRDQKMFCLRGEEWAEVALRDHFTLMVLLYLLDSKGADPTRAWIGEKDLKGGATFFRGPHALPLEELKKAFGSDLNGFWHAGQRLGGVELLFGDKALALTVFPKVPLAFVFWKEDDEFPPRVTIMFDSTIQKHFSLDGLWCMVAEVSRRLLEVREA